MTEPTGSTRLDRIAAHLAASRTAEHPDGDAPAEDAPAEDAAAAVDDGDAADAAARHPMRQFALLTDREITALTGHPGTPEDHDR